MLEIRNIPKEDIESWKLKLRQSRPSTVFREIASTYAVRQTELAIMLTDLFAGTSLPEVQAVWHWDLANQGRGYSDEEFDEKLAKLSLSLPQI